MSDDTVPDAEPFDLTITRLMAVPRGVVWRAWTDPEHLKLWWAPAPITTPDCEIDPRPGGTFRTLMRAPDGTEYPTNGIVLDIVSNERIVFTDTLVAGYRPARNPFFTAIITLEDHDGGTRYTARVLHKDGADRAAHERMGFFQGWNTCIDQLSTLVTRMNQGAA